jgi:hypothetical protein
VIVGPHPGRRYQLGIDRGFLSGLPQCRLDRIFVTVAGTARQAPGATLVRPRGAMLKYRLASVGQQQTGGTEATPMAVSLKAPHPAVTVTHAGACPIVLGG